MSANLCLSYQDLCRRRCVCDWQLAGAYLSLYLSLHVALTATLSRTSPARCPATSPRPSRLVVSRLVSAGRTRGNWTSAGHARSGMRTPTHLDLGRRRHTRAASRGVEDTSPHPTGRKATSALATPPGA
ncbi:hypothetical protein C8T65DRAFT_664203 [Cerioporus squamosus]|nr:hypothetical protein C8T65DRAFT_664203 [Cerioporus squamosus]